MILNLTQEEADALLTVLAYVGGEPKTSRRGTIESVRDKLFGFTHYNDSDIDQVKSEGVYFLPKREKK